MFILIALFGFMDYLIVLKWLTKYADSATAPGVIPSLIAFMTGQSGPSVDIFPKQQEYFKMLLLASAACVPLMLLFRPFITNSQNKRIEKEMKSQVVGSRSDDDFYRMDSKDETDLTTLVQTLKSKGYRRPDLMELLVTQLIVTIEFVLCTISNTASYLRLWALSLAHSCLTSVFFDLTIGKGLVHQNYVLCFLGYYVFIACTFAVLMCMDLLEGFLHTLRLHWVEF